MRKGVGAVIHYSSEADPAEKRHRLCDEDCVVENANSTKNWKEYFEKLPRPILDNANSYRFVFTIAT